jgi:transcriptional regulator with XRE-family HTH domain
MSNLRLIREQQNLTQEELAEQSGVSVRTIQRIEAGSAPKGYTLRVLSETLNIPELQLLVESSQISDEERSELLTAELSTVKADSTVYKMINLSSLLFIILPPLNVLLPLFLMKGKNAKDAMTVQIISIQLMWTILAPIVFLLWVLMKLGNSYNVLVLALLVILNLYIIIRNTIEIDKNNKLYYKLNFNMI